MLSCPVSPCAEGAAELPRPVIAELIWTVFLYIKIHFLIDVSYEIGYVNTMGENANTRLQTLGREGLASPDMPSARCVYVTEFEPSG